MAVPAAKISALQLRCCLPCSAWHQSLSSLLPNRRPVRTPFGGALLFPLQAAVCSPLEPAAVLRIASRLLELGAAPNISWCSVDGCHTPLSKALCLGNLQLAQLLVGAGAGGHGGGGWGGDGLWGGVGWGEGPSQ